MDEVPYEEYLKQDQELYRVVAPVLPSLQRLDAEQVETLVFYLKGLHGHVPTEGGRHAYAAFSGRLDGLRASQAQGRLRAQVVRQLIKFLGLGAVAGVLLVAGVLCMLGSKWAWGAGLALASVLLFVLAMTRYGWPAVLVAQEQDRQYFLESIRLARNCDELGWAGLFADSRSPRSVEDDDAERMRVAALAGQLRRALYQDEFMRFSTPRPRSVVGPHSAPARGVM